MVHECAVTRSEQPVNGPIGFWRGGNPVRVGPAMEAPNVGCCLLVHTHKLVATRVTQAIKVDA